MVATTTLSSLSSSSSAMSPNSCCLISEDTRPSEKQRLSSAFSWASGSWRMMRALNLARSYVCPGHLIGVACESFREVCCQLPDPDVRESEAAAQPNSDSHRRECRIASGLNEYDIDCAISSPFKLASLRSSPLAGSAVSPHRCARGCPLRGQGTGRCGNHIPEAWKPMTKTTTAPSAVRRRERGAARAAASRARAAAEGTPRPSSRGRPRRKKASASLYCLTVRLAPDERTHVQTAAATAGISVADYVRLQLIGHPREPQRPELIQMPSKTDAAYARAVTTLGKNTNQLARCWNAISAQVGAGKPFSAADSKSLLRVTERLIVLLDEIAPEQKGVLGRLKAAARVALGKAPAV